MFLSKLLKSVKMCYWSMKLKLISIIWIIWKVRHLIKSLNLITIIYIDYEVNVRIIKQISLFIVLTEKLNLYLIYASKYLQHFNLNIHHKLKKQHLVSDVLLWLVSTMLSEPNMKKDELNTLFVKIYTEMSSESKQHLMIKCHSLLHILRFQSLQLTFNEFLVTKTLLKTKKLI